MIKPNISLPDLFGDDLSNLTAAFPAGFTYRPDTLSESDETALVKNFTTLPFKQFEFHGYLGNRRTVSYGHKYDFSKQRLQNSDPLPDWLLPLRSMGAMLVGVEPEDLRQVLVTEYAPGAGIGWHRDKSMFENVVAFSFLTPCYLRFRRGDKGNWQRVKFRVEPRSAYVLAGNSREVWEHSIPPMEKLRYSVTFRNFRTPPSTD